MNTPTETPDSISQDSFNQETVINQNIVRCLRFTKGKLGQAARLIGVDRKTLYRRVKKMNLDMSQFGA